MEIHFPARALLRVNVILYILWIAGCRAKDVNNGDPGDTATVDASDVDGGFADGGVEDGGLEGGSADEGEESHAQRPGGHCLGVRGIFDCNLECWVDESRSYLGDGICDQGGRGPDFDCPALERDRGDCVESDDSVGTDDATAGGDSDSTGGAASDGSDGGESSGDDTGIDDLGETEGSESGAEDSDDAASVDGGDSTSMDTAGDESGVGDEDGSTGCEHGGTSSGGSGDTSGGSTGECSDTEVADCDGRCWPASEFHEAASDGECDDGSAGGLNLDCDLFGSDFGACL